MTIRKTITSASATAFPPAATRGLVLSALMVSLSGCGMISSVIEQDKLDYRGAKKAATLDVPPDLTQLERDNRYSIPETRGVASASTYQQPKGTTAMPAPSGQAVAVAGTDGVRIERSGNQRWLVVNQTPEQLWPQLKQFWADSGFTIINESATTGVMETDWAENRSKIPQDFIRQSIGKVFDSLYSTGERDKFRTRLERTPNGTEIYISHRGAEEVLVGAQKDSTTWTVRPNDPGLEAQLLSRLVAKLSGMADVKPAEAAVAAAVVAPQHAKLVGDTVEVDEGFDRAWRRVGLALDRVGFTVEDRDRVQGVYFVRYVDPDLAAKDGFLSKLFSFGASSDKAKEAQRFRVTVKSEAGATVSKVAVQSNDGKAETSPTGAKILKLLSDELK
ncbi:outer membrane protein assembly factor BamC [Massilia sp. P8910]|uniref:outer membrane protein assembly factor BamC n=1 Tax=Massilia antarctica TaxID=2765360 RepID=UPI0006BB5EC1|nr:MULTISPECIES: outer membrane protein assembly factor BamC [Massilia]MCE3608032.1 outer membrane protein assembly factor BamC [Massilia antarctica]MCY0911522.1 outer membrane protein assembly factor BamC [Massilia sp. H27-R4]CUI04870.1 FIG002207: Probable transmembrane protein [Janthinobacterium sp. CG23_2]CUU28656.1 FIG002207: Probable transmembrane protein [Janthinobacterium sp. CG23_2]